MIGNIKEIFPPKTGLREKQLLQDPGYVEDVRDALLHAVWSLQNTRRLPSLRLIILINFSEIIQQTTTDCIALSLFYFMSKTSEMCTMTTNYNVNSNSKYSN